GMIASTTSPPANEPAPIPAAPHTIGPIGWWSGEHTAAPVTPPTQPPPSWPAVLATAFPQVCSADAATNTSLPAVRRPPAQGTFPSALPTFLPSRVFGVKSPGLAMAAALTESGIYL